MTHLTVFSTRTLDQYFLQPRLARMILIWSHLFDRHKHHHTVLCPVSSLLQGSNCSRLGRWGPVCNRQQYHHPGYYISQELQALYLNHHIICTIRLPQAQLPGNRVHPAPCTVLPQHRSTHSSNTSKHMMPNSSTGKGGSTSHNVINM